VSVVYDESAFASGILYYRRSTDNGISFYPPISLGSGVTSYSGMVTSYYDHTVHVIYLITGGLWYRRSTDYGQTFGPPYEITSSGATEAKIVVVENRVYIFWRYYAGNQETWVVFRKSSSGGQSFGANQLLYRQRSQIGYYLSVAASKPFAI
jgi:hypothetical protein